MFRRFGLLIVAILLASPFALAKHRHVKPSPPAAVSPPGMGLAAAPAPGPVHPSVVLTCTAPGSLPSGAFFNFYRGTATGGESTTPINSTGQSACGYTDLAVTANSKYFYTAATCAVSLASGATVCSAASNEATATIPLLPSDLAPPTGLSGSAN